MQKLTNTLMALGNVLIALMASLLNLVKRSLSTKDLEEPYREEFERKMLESGEFKGVRMTRDEEGRYINPRLEKAWRAYVSFEVSTDTAV